MAASDLLRRHGWWWVMLLALAVWGLDLRVRWRFYQAANEYGRTAEPAAVGDSPTGREFGQRSRVQLSADSYHWTMQTQRMLAQGEWRVRAVNYDNAPHGREAHWSSPLRWWIAAVAWMESRVSGLPRPEAIERAAGYAGPALLFLLVAGLTPLVWRSFGNAAAAVFAAGLVCVAPVSSAFGVGAIDHHGVAVLCGLGTVLGVAAGVAIAGPAARRTFVFSGLCGGLGLWVSAATQVPVLAGIGVGAIAAAVVTRRDPDAFDAGGWRSWGAAGAVTSLAAYVLEYFPGHLGWRLEVNHPLYAVAWLGAAEILFRIARWQRGGALIGDGRERAIASFAVAAVLLLPAIVFAAGTRTFHVADPLLWALHADYIEEFGPLAEEFSGGTLPAWAVLLLVVNVVPLVGIPVLLAAVRGGTPGRARAALWLVLVPAILALAMALAQKRWLHLSGALWLGTAVVYVWLRPARGAARRDWALTALAALVFLPFPVAVARQAFALAQSGPEIGPAEMRELAARDVARWLRRRSGAEPVVVLSDPTTTSSLVYFGGLRGIGTLYWENLDGLRAAMEAAGAATPEEALRIFHERGITHLVVFSWQPFAEEAARLVRGLRAWQPAPADAFLARVQAGALPAWLRPLSYRLPGHPYFADKYVAVFEFSPGQSPAEAMVHQARYLLANGDEVAAARVLGALLERDPADLPALCTAAQVALRRRDGRRLDELWPRLTAQLARSRDIAAEDRLVIAQLFAAAGQAERAANELAGFWARADERELRRLPGGALTLALRLSAELDVAPPGARDILARKLVTNAGAP